LNHFRGAKGLLVAQQVLQQDDMQELALFSLMASPKHKQLKIRLDKVGSALYVVCGMAVLSRLLTS